MQRQGARVSLILALVFPAIVCAAVALAYYGYRYAEKSSSRTKTSLMENNQQLAEGVTNRVEERIDRVDTDLFEEVEWNDGAVDPPAAFDLPPGVESVVVLDAALRIRSIVPAPDPARRRRELERWGSYVRGLEWKSLKPWTPSHPGNFRHLHQLSEGKSVLIAYASKKTEDGHDYYVAAKLNVGLIAKDWIPDAMDDIPVGHRRVVILDEVARPIYGQPQPATQFQYESSFGKTLYAWRIQITPSDVAELLKQADTERLLGRLLVPVSLVIFAVGLSVLWLSVRAERRGAQLRSDFIANVSHELKTPLSLIRMFGELLATGKYKGEAMGREYAGIINREAERLSHLIDNVLDFARLERGKASYHFAEGHLEEVVERALDVYRHRLEKEKLRLRTEIESNLPAVRMDEGAMTLVLLNLVDNAVKYAGDGGEVSVQLRRVPGAVALSIADRGSGIAHDDQRRIFERFYRAENARVRNVRGSGIGLALVKHIAEAHGGRVEVESAPGRGSTFTVYVPVAPIMTPAPEERVAS
ncbi:MAG TPA: HAMP domain-containing sensor histidine kinase [Polyangia bacterium]|jgi:two-component system phosphate regulon sensor histidine kinase PhoR